MQVKLTEAESAACTANAKISKRLEHNEHNMSGNSQWIKFQNVETGYLGEVAVGNVLGCKPDHRPMFCGDNGYDLYFKAIGNGCLHIDVKSTGVVGRGCGYVSDYEIAKVSDTFVFCEVVNLTTVNIMGYCPSSHIRHIADLIEEVKDGKKKRLRYRIPYEKLLPIQYLIDDKRPMPVSPKPEPSTPQPAKPAQLSLF